MTRTYAAKRLLEHGPLEFTEMREITGWSYVALCSTLRQIIETGLAVVEKVGPHRNVYRLAA